MISSDVAVIPGLDPKQFHQFIIAPSLRRLANAMRRDAVASLASQVLLLGTALQESQLRWVRQLGVSGTAGGWGLFQDELADYHDLEYWISGQLLQYDWQKGVISMLQLPMLDPSDRLMCDLEFATCIARLHYWRVAEAMPQAGDLVGLGQYYKKYYNSTLGAATESQIWASFKLAGHVV